MALLTAEERGVTNAQHLLLRDIVHIHSHNEREGIHSTKRIVTTGCPDNAAEKECVPLVKFDSLKHQKLP